MLCYPLLRVQGEEVFNAYTSVSDDHECNDILYALYVTPGAVQDGSPTGPRRPVTCEPACEAILFLRTHPRVRGLCV